MGLFDFFNNKNPIPAIKDLIWMSHSAKLNGSLKLMEEHPDALFISWFSHAETEFIQFMEEKTGKVPEVKMAKSVTSFMVTNKTVIFLEHYPLRSKEENLIADWQTKKILVLGAMDEPLFEQFGSENIIQLMKKLGLKDDELIEHAMISKAIVNVQHKLEKMAGAEILANSSLEWFKKNTR